MQLIRPEKRKPAINITSLLDVLFLLLIFFMVSSTFKEQPGMKLELPSAKSSEVQPVEDLVLFVSADQALYLNDEPVTRQALRTKLADVAKIDDPPPLILQADSGVPHGLIVALMDMARTEGLRKITIATRVPAEDEPE